VDRHRYSPTTDLWAALSEASGKPVQQLWWVPLNASQDGADGKAEELPLFLLKVRGKTFGEAKPSKVH
jgi:hypothetical protein